MVSLAWQGSLCRCYCEGCQGWVQKKIQGWSLHVASAEAESDLNDFKKDASSKDFRMEASFNRHSKNIMPARSCFSTFFFFACPIPLSTIPDPSSSRQVKKLINTKVGQISATWSRIQESDGVSRVADFDALDNDMF